MTGLMDKAMWHQVKFGSLISSIASRVDKPSEAGVDRYVGLEHLDPGSMTVKRWGSPNQVNATKLLFEDGDVIFGRRRAYQKKVSKANFRGICSAHALVLRGKEGKLHPLFLPVFLSSDYFLDRAIKISVGSLSPTVNWKTLEAQEFLFPPFDQQERIANLFWKIENVIDVLGFMRLTAYETLQAFRHQKYINSVLVPLSAVASVERGVSWSASQQVADGTGVPVISIPNVREGYLELDNLTHVAGIPEKQIKASQLTEESILMVGSNGNPDRVGNVAIGNSETIGYLPASFLIHIRGQNNVRAKFLFEMLMSHDIQSQITNIVEGSTGLKNLAITWVRNLPVPGDSHDEALLFLAEVEFFKKAVESLDEEIRAVRQMRESLLNELFDGSK
jgi:restriction endonuclease S subunit